MTIVRIILLMLLLSASAPACPNCSASLGQQPASSRGGVATGSTAEAYNWGIVFLMSLPFAVIGSLGAMIYRLQRQAAQMHAMQGSLATTMPDNPVL